MESRPRVILAVSGSRHGSARLAEARDRRAELGAAASAHAGRNVLGNRTGPRAAADGLEGRSTAPRSEDLADLPVAKQVGVPDPPVRAVGPSDVQPAGHAAVTRVDVGHRRGRPVGDAAGEHRERVSAGAAAAGMVVVPPSDVLGEERADLGHVAGLERRAELPGDREPVDVRQRILLLRTIRAWPR